MFPISNINVQMLIKAFKQISWLIRYHWMDYSQMHMVKILNWKTYLLFVAGSDLSFGTNVDVA